MCLPVIKMNSMKFLMHRLLALLLVFVSTGVSLPAFAQNPGQAIHPVGEFSNMQFTEEHAYGYAVQLWRSGNSLIGVLLVSEGLQGDTPTGMLENIKFNLRTGKLSFTARLTTGMTYFDGRSEPSRDLFEFSGVLETTVLTGTLKRTDLSVGSDRVTPERVRLNAQPEAVLLSASSEIDWKRQIDEILKRRGPKW